MTENKIYQLDQRDPNFASELAKEPGAEAILRCYSCSTCTAGCPVRKASDKYNPRQIIRLVLLGMKDEVLKSDFIWLCSSCYTCQERCPQGVKITDIMTALKNMAARAGFTPTSYLTQLDLIRKMGRLYELDDFDNKKRQKAGLPAIQMKGEIVEKLYQSVKEKSS